MRFDHVGVATRDAADLADLFDGLLDAPVAHEETFDGMSVVFLELDDSGYFELLEPTAGGAIASYLDREDRESTTSRSRPTTSRPRSAAPAISGSTSSTRPRRGVGPRGRVPPPALDGRCARGVRRTLKGAYIRDGDRFNRTAGRPPTVFRDLSRPIRTGMPTYPGDPT